MNTSCPKVSIVMNCYNGEKYLNEALNSIYDQTFQDWEIIFFDNNSSDKSAEIAKRYDSRLKYHYNKTTIPLGYARNKALSMTSGKWICFLDTDDQWLPHKLETQLKEIDDTDIALSYAGTYNITESGKIINTIIPKKRNGIRFADILSQFEIDMVTPIISKKFLTDHNLNFNPKMYVSEEVNLFTRIAAKGKIHTIQEPLGKYRLSESSLTNKNMEYWSLDRKLTIEELEKENPGIQMNYKPAFEHLNNRILYYEACLHMKKKDNKKAKNKLRKIKNKNYVYNILYITSFFPFLWYLVHNKYIKSLLTSALQPAKVITGQKL